MYRRTTLLVLVLWCVLAWAPTQASQAPGEETWMSVRLSGRKIGHLLISRKVDGDQVVTTQTLSIMLNRNGKSIPMDNVDRSVESLTGAPLAFSSRMSMSSMDSSSDGSIDAHGWFNAVNQVAGAKQSATARWPQGALLAEGLRQAMLKQAPFTGKHYDLLIFDQATQQVVPIQVEVLGNEQVNLPEGSELLNHQRQTMRTAKGTQLIDLWLAADGQVRKGVLSMLGRDMEMLACSRTCAEAPVQDLDMFRAAIVDSPRPLPPYLRENFLRYIIHTGSQASQPLAETDEQRVHALADGDWEVDIGPATAGGQPPPTDADREPNLWVQSDAPPIQALARQAVGNATTDQDKMRRLRMFVSNYITGHGLDVGYASALEVASTRRGDCTEYAILLTALARAQGIPARMVTGMVYADRYAGNSRVFLPHAWVQAWVNHRWQSFDAALRHFDTSHIAIDSGDGDPWHFFNAGQVFATMRIDRVLPFWEILDTPPAGKTL
ncbi:transglutaminase-like domain-containing protein [Dyella sp.]|uniref:transglutaminase-like domain-containing protein n=1 Tax=Dyella sp. TaxID=1869338 RepID=UPI002ED5F915